MGIEALALLGALGGMATGLALRPLAARLGGPSRLSCLLAPACAALDVAVLMTVRDGAQAVADLVLVAALALLAMVDVVALRLPDVITLPLIAGGLAESAVFGGGMAARLISAVVGYGGLALLAVAYRRRSGRTGLGGGDAKLLAAAGAWLGWQALPQVLLIAAGLGLAGFGVRALLKGVASLRQPAPFGPALCVGILIVRLINAAYGPS